MIVSLIGISSAGLSFAASGSNCSQGSSQNPVLEQS
jgi:hypothetical protein